MPRWGFIGLGSQGAPMARRMIESGNEVVLWARRPESLYPFADTAAIIAEGIPQLGQQVEHCGICVVDDAGVQQICDQLFPAMTAGSRVAIHSTIHPQRCIALQQQASAQGIELVDAPVSGGGEGAARGDLTVMVGGSEQAFAAVKPVFATFAGLIAHLGDVGAGQTAKLVNNNLMAANLAMAHHALRAADKLGIDRDGFVKLIGVSSGNSFSFNVCARMPSPVAFEHGAKLLAKDVRLLGEAMGEDVDYNAISDVAKSFLELALLENQ